MEELILIISKIAIKAGANILVSGTTIFKSNNGDIKKNIDTIKIEVKAIMIFKNSFNYINQFFFFFT